MNLDDEWMHYGDSMLPSQRIIFRCSNENYTIDIVANKPERGIKMGMYKIGEIWNPDVTISFGTIHVYDVANARFWGTIPNDTTSSSINIALGTDHEIKGSFNLRCFGDSITNIHTFSGDFHLLF